MNDADFEKVCQYFLGKIREKTPIDTGNLRKNATKLESIENGKRMIYVDEEIAPYFKYVNTYRFNRTYENKNFLYFEKAVESGVNDIAVELGGSVEIV